MSGISIRARKVFGNSKCFCCLGLAVSLSFCISVAWASELENPPSGEDAAIKAIVSLALGELQKRYPADSPLVRRDAHAKAHGCVKATFEVKSDLPAQFRFGFLAKLGQSKAWVRFSNGAFEPGPDTGMDGRGMALKILHDDEPGRAHDILMINHPVFFSPDAIDYLDFATAGALTGRSEGLKQYFVPSAAPWRWRLRQGLIAYKIASKKIESPLSTQYYSMVPYLFGVGRAVKYSARPCSEAAPTNSTSERASNFLRSAMREDLNRGPACFHLMLQERRGEMPIEDATREWSETDSPFVEVGTVQMPRQQFDTSEQDAFCENLTFSPWNAPADHRPLGGINRVRKALYEEISTYRLKRNKGEPVDPIRVWNDRR